MATKKSKSTKKPKQSDKQKIKKPKTKMRKDAKRQAAKG